MSLHPRISCTGATASLTMVLMDAGFKDRTQLKVLERHRKGFTRLRMEHPRYHKTTLTKGTGTEQIWVMVANSNSNSPVMLMTTMKIIMSVTATAAT